MFTCVQQRRIHHKIGCPVILKGEIQEFFVCVHFWCQLELHVCGDSVYLLVWDLVLSHLSIYVVRIISWNMLQISCVGDLEMFRSVCHCLLVCLFVCLFFCYFKAIFFSIFMDTTYQSFRKFCVPSELLDLLEHSINYIFSASMCLLSAIWWLFFHVWVVAVATEVIWALVIADHCA